MGQLAGGTSPPYRLDFRRPLDTGLAWHGISLRQVRPHHLASYSAPPPSLTLVYEVEGESGWQFGN
jgi:hypothetical protein